MAVRRLAGGEIGGRGVYLLPRKLVAAALRSAWLSCCKAFERTAAYCQYSGTSSQRVGSMMTTCLLRTAGSTIASGARHQPSSRAAASTKPVEVGR